MSRQLNKRASSAQKVELLKYLEDNMDVAKNIANDTDGFRRLKEKWNEAANLLNAVGGSNKAPTEWKRYFYDWRKRASDRYMALKKNMKKQGKDDPKHLLDHLDDLDQRLINILSVEEIEQMSGHPIEPLEPGMLVCSPLHIAGSRSNSPLSDTTLRSRPVSEVWIPKDDNFSDELEGNASSSSSEFNLPNPPKSAPERKKRKRCDETEMKEDLHMLEDVVEMKKKKIAHLKKMEEMEKKKLDLMIRKEKRESHMYEMMLKKDEREAEEHKIKMHVMKAKLEVLKKQLKK